MLSSMLGNSEGQWRLLHLRQAEKVRADWSCFFEKNGMYDDLMMIYNDLYI